MWIEMVGDMLWMNEWSKSPHCDAAGTKSKSFSRLEESCHNIRFKTHYLEYQRQEHRWSTCRTIPHSKSQTWVSPGCLVFVGEASSRLAAENHCKGNIMMFGQIKQWK